MIELTEAQREAVRSGQAVRLAATEIGVDIVLLRAEQYDSIRELLIDEQEKAAWAGFGRKAANSLFTEDS